MAIKILDVNTISKIAAGEVIENPSSVVKELVENSIDAGATHIIVEVSGGGTEIIKVSDDGVGFNKEDIEIAFLQHATSKLSDISDLENIKSFGFRGEALSSIASVSDITLISKRKVDKNLFGYRYNINFGNKSEISEIAANEGTTFEVKGLFNNVPVRKKFLKSIGRENALIEDIVTKFALVRTDISFELIIDGKRKFFSTGDSNLKNILFNLYGREVFDNLIQIEDENNGIKVYGYAAKPMIARNTRNDEIYFVNNRYIKNKTISKAIEGAYEEFQMMHKYPFVVLKIDVDSRQVDVNVHPKKMEVRFSNDDQIYFAVFNAIHNALKNESLIHEEKLIYEDKLIDEELSENENKLANENQINQHNSNVSINVDNLPSMSDSFNTYVTEGINISNLYKNLSGKFEEKPFIQETLSENHKYIGQIFNTYILVEFDNKLYIIDQHAAHEKINFERLMKAYKEGATLNQRIFPSIILRLTPLQHDAVLENIESFKKIGYEIEDFGDNDIKVDSVPYNIFNIGNEKLLLDMIDSFIDGNNKEQYDSIIEKIASISCKKAIKANYILSENEVKQLLRDLFSLDNPYNCPHGRPTIISLSKQEFEKRFGRIV